MDVSAVRFGERPSAELFDRIAEECASSVAPKGDERGGSSRDINKSSQLRRFYDEIVMWQERVGASQERFDEYQPYIRMLKAKVAYAKARGHVDANFELLLRQVVDQSTGPGTLRQAKLFMEAFMAYYKVHMPK